MLLKAGSYSKKFLGSTYGFAATYGSLTNNNYRGTTIASFTTISGEGTLGGVSIKTSITFKSAPNDKSNIKIRINGTVYTFIRASNTTYGCSEIIFTSEGTYTIEFLN